MATTPPKAKSDLEVGEQIEVLKEDIAKLSKAVGQLVDREVSEGKARVRRKAREAQGAAEDMAERARSEAEATYRELEVAVERNPLAAIGVAAGLGFLFGLLTRGGR